MLRAHVMRGLPGGKVGLVEGAIVDSMAAVLGKRHCGAGMPSFERLCPNIVTIYIYIHK